MVDQWVKGTDAFWYDATDSGVLAYFIARNRNIRDRESVDVLNAINDYLSSPKGVEWLERERRINPEFEHPIMVLE